MDEIKKELAKAAGTVATDVAEDLVRPTSKSTGEYRGVNIGEDIVDIRAYDYDAFEEVKDYYPIIVDLIKGDIEIADLVDIARENGVLQNMVMTAALSSSNADCIILA